MHRLYALILCLGYILLVSNKLTYSLELSNTVDRQLAIRLCCPISEFLNVTSYQCETIPNDFSSSSWAISNFWSDGNTTKVNIIQDLQVEVATISCEEPYIYGFFEYNNESDHCYTPYYHRGLEKYIIATVDCSSLFRTYNYIYDTYILGITFSSFFLLLTIVVYGILRELRHTLHWKLFICHFVSWILSHIFIILSVRLMCVELVLYGWIFFCSSRLWLNVIGYEICLQYISKFKQYNLKELDKRRFSVYSFIVWSVTLATSLSSWFLKDSKPMDNWVSLIPIEIVLCMAFLGFGYFIFEMIAVRKKVFNTRKGKHFIRNSIPIIACLAYMSVLPWSMIPLWLWNTKNVCITIIFYVYLIVEGPIVFGIFVPARKLKFLWENRMSAGHNRDADSTGLREDKTTHV
ncbi:uncharacterized protein LOC142242580 isoform X1 [Haematobia irritans]|uniref:uncharacterized protein LOC142242580 isoform X1 n=1 Tax=Haematobia irritans TaxID=7368 RepID=UPI003F50B2F5